MPHDTGATGFWRTVPGILTACAGLLTAIATLVVALSQAGLVGDPREVVSEVPPAVTGTWAAQVAYPWSVTLQESFSFRVEEGRVFGTATFLGTPRAIENGTVAGERLSFTTRAEEMLGSETRGFENRYDGIVSSRGINFVLQDTRGNGPVEFTARRSGGPGNEAPK